MVQSAEDSLSNSIAQAIAGDQAAFSVLFDQYKNLVFKTSLLLLGSRTEAEDAMQEVFHKKFAALATFDASRAAFSTWLYRITVNQCLNHRRVRRPLTAPLDEANLTSQDKSRPGWENIYAEAEAVRQAVHSLSPKLRAALVLRYYSELSLREMSQVLEVPLGTVKSRLDLALRCVSRELRTGQPAAGPSGKGESFDER